MHVVQFLRILFMFMEFSRNRLADDELSLGDSSYFSCFLGSREEPPGGELSAARRRKLRRPVFWVDHELPGSEEHPPGDAFRFYLIFGFCMFWVALVRWKRHFNNIWTKRKGLIVKSHGSAKESNEIGYE